MTSCQQNKLVKKIKLGDTIEANDPIFCHEYAKNLQYRSFTINNVGFKIGDFVIVDKSHRPAPIDERGSSPKIALIYRIIDKVGGPIALVDWYILAKHFPSQLLSKIPPHVPKLLGNREVINDKRYLGRNIPLAAIHDYTSVVSISREEDPSIAIETAETIYANRFVISERNDKLQLKHFKKAHESILSNQRPHIEVPRESEPRKSVPQVEVNKDLKVLAKKQVQQSAKTKSTGSLNLSKTSNTTKPNQEKIGTNLKEKSVSELVTIPSSESDVVIVKNNLPKRNEKSGKVQEKVNYKTRKDQGKSKTLISVQNSDSEPEIQKKTSSSKSVQKQSKNETSDLSSDSELEINKKGKSKTRKDHEKNTQIISDSNSDFEPEIPKNSKLTRSRKQVNKNTKFIPDQSSDSEVETVFESPPKLRNTRKLFNIESQDIPPATQMSRRPTRATKMDNINDIMDEPGPSESVKVSPRKCRKDTWSSEILTRSPEKSPVRIKIVKNLEKRKINFLDQNSFMEDSQHSQDTPMDRIFPKRPATRGIIANAIPVIEEEVDFFEKKNTKQKSIKDFIVTKNTSKVPLDIRVGISEARKTRASFSLDQGKSPENLKTQEKISGLKNEREIEVCKTRSSIRLDQDQEKTGERQQSEVEVRKTRYSLNSEKNTNQEISGEKQINKLQIRLVRSDEQKIQEKTSEDLIKNKEQIEVRKTRASISSNQQSNQEKSLGHNKKSNKPDSSSSTCIISDSESDHVALRKTRASVSLEPVKSQSEKLTNSEKNQKIKNLSNEFSNSSSSLCTLSSEDEIVPKKTSPVKIRSSNTSNENIMLENEKPTKFQQRLIRGLNTSMDSNSTTFSQFIPFDESTPVLENKNDRNLPSSSSASLNGSNSIKSLELSRSSQNSKTRKFFKSPIKPDVQIESVRVEIPKQKSSIGIPKNSPRKVVSLKSPEKVIPIRSPNKELFLDEERAESQKKSPYKNARHFIATDKTLQKPGIKKKKNLFIDDSTESENSPVVSRVLRNVPVETMNVNIPVEKSTDSDTFIEDFHHTLSALQPVVQLEKLSTPEIEKYTHPIKINFEIATSSNSQEKLSTPEIEKYTHPIKINFEIATSSNSQEKLSTPEIEKYSHPIKINLEIATSSNSKETDSDEENPLPKSMREEIRNDIIKKITTTPEEKSTIESATRVLDMLEEPKHPVMKLFDKNLALRGSNSTISNPSEYATPNVHVKTPRKRSKSISLNSSHSSQYVSAESQQIESLISEDDESPAKKRKEDDSPSIIEGSENEDETFLSFKRIPSLSERKIINWEPSTSANCKLNVTQKNEEMQENGNNTKTSSESSSRSECKYQISSKELRLLGLSPSKETETHSDSSDSIREIQSLRTRPNKKIEESSQNTSQRSLRSSPQKTSNISVTKSASVNMSSKRHLTSGGVDPKALRSALHEKLRKIYAEEEEMKGVACSSSDLLYRSTEQEIPRGERDQRQQKSPHASRSSPRKHPILNKVAQDTQPDYDNLGSLIFDSPDIYCTQKSPVKISEPEITDEEVNDISLCVFDSQDSDFPRKSPRKLTQESSKNNSQSSPKKSAQSSQSLDKTSVSENSSPKKSSNVPPDFDISTQEWEEIHNCDWDSESDIPITTQQNITRKQSQSVPQVRKSPRKMNNLSQNINNSEDHHQSPRKTQEIRETSPGKATPNKIHPSPGIGFKINTPNGKQVSEIRDVTPERQITPNTRTSPRKTPETNSKINTPYKNSPVRLPHLLLNKLDATESPGSSAPSSPRSLDSPSRRKQQLGVRNASEVNTPEPSPLPEKRKRGRPKLSDSPASGATTPKRSLDEENITTQLSPSQKRLKSSDIAINILNDDDEDIFVPLNAGKTSSCEPKSSPFPLKQSELKFGITVKELAAKKKEEKKIASAHAEKLYNQILERAEKCHSPKPRIVPPLIIPKSKIIKASISIDFSDDSDSEIESEDVMDIELCTGSSKVKNASKKLSSSDVESVLKTNEKVKKSKVQTPKSKNIATPKKGISKVATPKSKQKNTPKKVDTAESQLNGTPKKGRRLSATPQPKPVTPSRVRRRSVTPQPTQVTPSRVRRQSTTPQPNQGTPKGTPQFQENGTPKRGRPKGVTPKKGSVATHKHTLGSAKKATPKRALRHVRQIESEIAEQDMPGREQQMDDIERFIQSKINDKSGGCMYISGVPGTGKTASVTQVVRRITELRNEGQIPDFKLVQVSGMELTQPQQVFSRMAETMFGMKMSPSLAHDKLDGYFKNKDKKRSPTVLIIDELDMLCTRRQDVVYSLFDWPGQTNAMLTVLAIANTMDLPERLLKGKVTSRLGLTRMTFQPYTFKQLEKIVAVKLSNSQDFSSDAVQLVARKVASVSGDARRALDICRRAGELVDEGENVEMRHVTQALKEMLESPVIETVRHCNILSKFFLRCLLSEMRRTGLEESTFEDIYNVIKSTAVFNGIEYCSMTQVADVCAQLAAMRLIIAEDGACNNIKQRIALNVSTDELHYALEPTR